MVKHYDADVTVSNKTEIARRHTKYNSLTECARNIKSHPMLNTDVRNHAQSASEECGRKSSLIVVKIFPWKTINIFF